MKSNFIVAVTRVEISRVFICAESEPGAVRLVQSGKGEILEKELPETSWQVTEVTVHELIRLQKKLIS